MKRLNLIQGSSAWAAHRAQHFNASDAPAMLGCSPYKSRQQLLHELHTGIAQEVDEATQRRFDDGHRFEALARPLGEKIIGEPLYPVVGTEGELSASFDGLTMAEDVAFEHKSLNDDLRSCMKDEGNGYDLPKHYRVQMEQQLLVSGAERVLFMATKWTPSGEIVEERHCWYASDPALRAEIVAGWKQFAEDLANYKAPAASTVEKIVAEPVEALPAVSVIVEGALTVRENFSEFQRRLMHFLEHRLIREPKTDQEFANLEAQIKEMKAAEEALQRSEAQMLAQIQSVDQAKKTKDMLHQLVRTNRLMAEKLLASEKERRRSEIVSGAIKAIQTHIDGLNTRLGGRYMPTILADFAGCIKGLKSLASMEDRVATELARLKIGANDLADKIDANLKHLREHAAEFKHLFPDAATIVQKAPDDLQALVAARIATHRAEQERKLEAERARIRAEEEARARAQAQREQQEREAEERRHREEAEAEERRKTAEHDRINNEGAARLLAATDLAGWAKKHGDAASADTARRLREAALGVRVPDVIQQLLARAIADRKTLARNGGGDYNPDTDPLVLAVRAALGVQAVQAPSSWEPCEEPDFGAPDFTKWRELPSDGRYVYHRDPKDISRWLRSPVPTAGVQGGHEPSTEPQCAARARPRVPGDNSALWCNRCGEGTVAGLCRDKSARGVAPTRPPSTEGHDGVLGLIDRCPCERCVADRNAAAGVKEGERG